MIDYSTGVSLGRDQITALVCVSTVSFSSSEYYGSSPDALIETWIFSKDSRQRSVQVFHRTRSQAVKAHKYISDNMRKKFCQTTG